MASSELISSNCLHVSSLCFSLPSARKLNGLSRVKISRSVDNTCKITKRARTMATVATEEIEKVIVEKLNFGDVTTMTRAGTSGWAVMHRATTETGKRLFIKVSREDVSMFEGEAAGLSAMFSTETIRVPEVFHCGPLSNVSGSFIVMEGLELSPTYDQGELGRNLARMHLAEPILPEAREGKFGFSVDNTIGATPQPNGWMDDWISFFRDRRLKHQLLLTGDSSLIERGSKLCMRIHELFDDIQGDIKPSLLHGDLWAGNISGEASSPVIFDPASYYGHHEADFGMSWCGGFAPGFWKCYHDLIPRAPRFDTRRKLYQLYHYLNHYNLFGGGYYGMADLLLNQLLNELD